MAENIIYRKVEINEIEQYHAIRLDCLKNYPQNFGTLYEEELKKPAYKFDYVITEQPASDFLMGAFLNEKLIGMCGFIQEKREKTKHIGEISGMYVMSAYSGQKIGAELLNSTIQAAFTNSAIEQIILAVAGKNHIAQKLYKKFGFEEYGKLNNYFKENDKYEIQIFMTLVKNKIQNRI